MAGLLVLRLPLLLVLGLGFASADKGHFTCAGKQPGLFGNPGAECSIYYFVCQYDGSPEGLKLACPQGKLFDKSLKRCKAPTQIRNCETFVPASPQADPPVFTRSKFRPPQSPPQRKFRPQQGIRQQFAPRPEFQLRPSNPKFSLPQPQNPPQSKIRFSPPRPKLGLSNKFQLPASPRQKFVQTPPQTRGYGRVEQAAPPRGDSECFGLEDGDYSRGCSNIYFSCAGATAMERECPLPSLKFDQSTGQCLMPEEVPDCGGAPKPKPPQPQFEPTVKDSRCEGRASGIFELPGQQCSDKFLACNDGFGQEMTCAAGLMFDVETGSCLGKMYVRACGGHATPKPPIPTPPNDLPLDPSYTCAGLEDGDYPHPQIKCAYGYYSCVGGIPFARECSSKELRFDPAQKMCEVEAHNTVCGGSPRVADQTATHAPFVTESEFSCKGQADGLYDDHYGCSSTFYSCSGGQASKFKCAGSLVFDMESKRCLGQNFVKACGGVPTPVPDRIINDSGTPLPAPDIDFDCSVGEGAHSLGCSHEYVVCSFGRPYRRECATTGLKFDDESKQCLGESFVAECGGHPTPKPDASVSDFAAPTPVDFDCSSEEDGIYRDRREPCSPHFFTCSSGQAAKILCPSGLFFDQEQKACLVQAVVKDCGGAPIPSPPLKKPILRSPIQLQSKFRPQLSPKAFIPPRSPSFSPPANKRIVQAPPRPVFQPQNPPRQKFTFNPPGTKTQFIPQAPPLARNRFVQTPPRQQFNPQTKVIRNPRIQIRHQGY